MQTEALPPLKRVSDAKVTIGCRASPALVARLRAICKRDGFALSRSIERALAEWVIKMERARR